MDIIKIFKSKARRRIFRLYFTNPDNSYYLRELERELQISVSIVRKELIALEKLGIFTLTKKGNLSYYSLNKEYLLYDELKSIVFKTIGVQGLLAERILPIEGIETAFIYGSYAKNQENASSDIDLFIIGNVDENTLAVRINKLEKELKREINYSLYSMHDFARKKKEKDSFIMDVIDNKKIFLKGDKNEL